MATAYALGRLTAAEVIIAAYFVVKQCQKSKQNGATWAVGLGPDQVAKYLEGGEDEVKLAATNSQGSVTLSGEFAPSTSFSQPWPQTASSIVR